MNLGLHGKVALVLGASSGLGAATARALAAEGARVALAGRRLDVLRRGANELDGAICVELDLVDASSTEAAVDTVRDELGPVEILILNGGGPPASVAAELEIAALERDASLLLHGAVRLVRSCLPAMRAAGWGRIIAIGSTAVQEPIPGLVTSSMYRAALTNYLKLLAGEVGPDNVTVNVVHPGRISTPRVEQLDLERARRAVCDVADIQRATEARIPLGRYGRPEELAAAIAFLSAEQSSFITGQQIRIDGGMVAAV
jgi:3-oxoacyl-[acyl-carrier protein] reductase